MNARRKRLLRIAARISIVLGLAIGFGLANGVWLPDLVFGGRHTVARQEISNGGWVEVVQYWWRPAKSYRTEVVIKLPYYAEPEVHPSGERLEKIWTAELELHSDSVTVTERHRGGGYASSRIYFDASQRGKWDDSSQ